MSKDIHNLRAINFEVENQKKRPKKTWTKETSMLYWTGKMCFTHQCGSLVLSECHHVMVNTATLSATPIAGLKVLAMLTLFVSCPLVCVVN